ncbi:MAG: hypothetical protein EBS30_03285, partial [Planctomycetes bacterium]|nr:hypothetical protein [Planctomycetota bacterium]
MGSIRRKPTLPDTSDLPMVQAEAPRLLAGDTDFLSVVSALKSGRSAATPAGHSPDYDKSRPRPNGCPGCPPRA